MILDKKNLISMYYFYYFTVFSDGMSFWCLFIKHYGSSIWSNVTSPLLGVSSLHHLFLILRYNIPLPDQRSKTLTHIYLTSTSDKKKTKKNSKTIKNRILRKPSKQKMLDYYKFLLIFCWISIALILSTHYLYRLKMRLNFQKWYACSLRYGYLHGHLMLF